MNDLIERDRAMKVAMWFGTSEQKYNHSFIKKRVMEIPSADIPQGEWISIIEVNDFGETYQAGIYCSKCGETFGRETNFCPYCGADMRGDGK